MMAAFEVIVYTSGLVSCSACAPADMPIEEVTRLVNLQTPTGISSQWELSDDDEFALGVPMPCVCDQDASRMHYLFNC